MTREEQLAREADENCDHHPVYHGNGRSNITCQRCIAAAIRTAVAEERFLWEETLADKRNFNSDGRVKTWADARERTKAEEREVCIQLVCKYLVFNSQRAVSWHEVQDLLTELRKRGAQP